MAKQLSSKVEHCPSCGKLKSKTAACKRCGFEETKSATPCYIQQNRCFEINFNLDVGNITEVKINGISFKRQ